MFICAFQVWFCGKGAVLNLRTDGQVLSPNSVSLLTECIIQNFIVEMHYFMTMAILVLDPPSADWDFVQFL